MTMIGSTPIHANAKTETSTVSSPPEPGPFPRVDPTTLDRVAPGTIVEVTRPAFVAEEALGGDGWSSRRGIAVTAGTVLGTVGSDRQKVLAGDRGWVLTGTTDPVEAERAAKAIMEQEPTVGSLAWHVTVPSEESGGGHIRGGDVYLYNIDTQGGASSGLAGAIASGAGSMQRLPVTGVTEGGRYFAYWHLPAHGIVDPDATTWRATAEQRAPFDDRNGLGQMPSTSPKLPSGINQAYNGMHAGTFGSRAVYLGPEAAETGLDYAGAIRSAERHVHSYRKYEYGTPAQAVVQAADGTYSLYALMNKGAYQMAEYYSYGKETSATRTSNAIKAYVGEQNMFEFADDAVEGTQVKLPRPWWRWQ